jgi:Protein of unknown function (DUF3579)
MLLGLFGKNCYARMQKCGVEGMTTPLDSGQFIVIQGITEEGKTFRPSDWNERLCGTLSCFGSEHRLRYSPLVKPYNEDELHCVLVDPKLAEEEPRLFRFLMGFAQDNALKVILPMEY